MKTQKYRILLPVFALLLVFLFVGGTLSPVKQTARFPLLTEAQLREQTSLQLPVKSDIEDFNRTQSADPSDFFIENKGQWAPEVKYLVRQGGMNAWITTSGIVYDFYKIERTEKGSSVNSPADQFNPVSRFNPENRNERIIGHVVNMKLENARENAPYVAEDKSEAYYNYFIGNDESKWASYVGLYGEVTAANVYRNIDARYYFDEEGMRYDFVLNPGANVSDINMNFEGAYGTDVNAAGELVIYTSLGEVTQRKLYAYQEINGSKQQVACAFTKTKTGAITFSAEWKDKTKPLVIDPLVYSTFLGGSGWEWGINNAVDFGSNSYNTGVTYSSNYPTVAGSYASTFNGGACDVFATKINPDGTSLIFSTFIGGNGNDEGWGLNLRQDNSIVLSGFSASSNFPTTAGAFDETPNGGTDVFLLKLNSDGSSLIYSTLIGGAGDDYGMRFRLDVNGNAYITGMTSSNNYPITSGSVDATYNGGWDGYVTKMNSSGTNLVYSTYLGGSGNDFNSWSRPSISVGADGSAYVTGTVESSDFPVTAGAYDVSYNGGTNDVIVSKINPSGSMLTYSTFIGGGSDDVTSGIRVATDGCAYVVGGTASSDFPLSQGAYRTPYNGSCDVFFFKINAMGSSIEYSSIFGGNDMDYAGDLELSSDNNFFISGDARSGNFPSTVGAFDETHNGAGDAFLIKFSIDNNSLLYSTFFGGNDWDFGSNIAINPVDGSIFALGTTRSGNFPVTAGSFDVTQNGDYDAYVLHISDENLNAPPLSPSTVSSDTLYSLPGDTILVPINITNFANVGAISLQMNYDPAVMTFVEAVNWSALIPSPFVGGGSGMVNVCWYALEGFSAESEKLVDLKFVYHGDSTAFAFDQAFCEITDISEQPISITYTNGAVYPDLGTPLTGILSYRNAAFTPLNNVIVRLMKNGAKIDSSSANNTGAFGWTNVVQGNYTLQAVPPAAWGGVNSTDALVLRRYVAGLRPLDSLRILAGDVNNSGTVTSADALLIVRRFVKLDNAFARGNWVFETPSLRKLHQAQTQDILGICVGDVNASFVPGLLKPIPSVQYAPQGEIAIQPGNELSIPVYVNTKERLGAVTLLFDYDQNNMKILGVTSDMEGLVYNAQNGQLAIAWEALEGIEAGEEKPLLYIRAEVLENASGDIRVMVNTDVSEIADVEGFVLQGAIVSFPAIGAVIPKEFALEQNFPNPFNPATTIQYDIPTNSHVRVEIFNTLGEVVEVLADAVQAPGRYSVEWNAKNFTTGVYFYRITAESGTKNFTQVKKLMLIK